MGHMGIAERPRENHFKFKKRHLPAIWIWASKVDAKGDLKQPQMCFFSNTLRFMCSKTGIRIITMASAIHKTTG